MLDNLDESTMCLVRRLQHEHDADVDGIMVDTFEARKQWIQNRKPPIRTIFAMFPPLKDILSSHVSFFLSLSTEMHSCSSHVFVVFYIVPSVL